jgi:hypothetical protein
MAEVRYASALRDQADARRECVRNSRKFRIDDLSADAVPWIRAYRDVQLEFAAHLEREALDLEGSR